MSNQQHHPTPSGQPLYGAPVEAPVGRQPGSPVGQLFPVMAVLLAQVLDLDQTTKESPR
jgi:hypothetical protein